MPLSIMNALRYLKHAFNESDVDFVQRWADTSRWQSFSGGAHYEDRQPCDATTLVEFGQLLGEEGVEELLAQTINVVVDSTVQHKVTPTTAACWRLPEPSWWKRPVRARRLTARPAPWAPLCDRRALRP